MTALVTQEQVTDRLRIDEPYVTTDLTRMAEEATDIVLRYIKKDDDAWTTETVPPRVRAAILQVVKNMHDELDRPLSDEVKDRLLGDRDPALA